MRLATVNDCQKISEIYNQGIDERTATFETTHRSAEEVFRWLDGVHPTVVCVVDGHIRGFATTSPYSARKCYSGIAEFSVYVERNFRNMKLGKSIMESLIEECERGGFWKLVSRIFVENKVSRKLMTGLGFREVGIYEKHGRISGVWRDVVIVELLINSNLD